MLLLRRTFLELIRADLRRKLRRRLLHDLIRLSIATFLIVMTISITVPITIFLILLTMLELLRGLRLKHLRWHLGIRIELTGWILARRLLFDRSNVLANLTTVLARAVGFRVFIFEDLLPLALLLKKCLTFFLFLR